MIWRGPLGCRPTDRPLVGEAIKSGQLIPLLEPYNPCEGEEVHLVFLGGAHMPARVRCFVDFMVERFGKATAPVHTFECSGTVHTPKWG
jgi:DNA-binding transcriptional LysR family regulator